MIYHVVVLGVVLLLIALIGGYTVVTGVPPMPTAPKVMKAMFALLPDDVDGKVYDLGSGWGHLTIGLARRLPKASIVGIECSPLPWLISKVWAAKTGLVNLRLVRGDLFRQPLQDADLVICYLMTGPMARLSRKLAAELRPGTIIVSNTFMLPGREPAAVAEVDDLYRTKVYLYRV